VPKQHGWSSWPGMVTDWQPPRCIHGHIILARPQRAACCWRCSHSVTAAARNFPVGRSTHTRQTPAMILKKRDFACAAMIFIT
jgi:hypothetical protein